MADSPYPQLKKTHTMAHAGRPWRDIKPPPSAPVWAIIQGFGSYWSLIAAIDLGVFDELQRGGPSPAATVAERLDVSGAHLRHLLDALVTFGFLEQVSDVYSLTETAERYLCTAGPASMAALVAVAPGPHANWTGLADTIRNGRVRAPIEAGAAAFYGPLVTATFATQLRAASRLGAALGWSRRPGMRVLDLGAGRAPWAIAALTQSAGSTAVVNDLPGVVELAVETLAENDLGRRTEIRSGDFHEIDIEAGRYDLVVLGHICRTEGEERATALLARAATALVAGGQLVLADYFADNDRKHNPFGVQMGLTMLASTTRGGMLTHRQVHGWLCAAGLESIRLMEPIGFNQVYVGSAPRHRMEEP